MFFATVFLLGTLLQADISTSPANRLEFVVGSAEGGIILKNESVCVTEGGKPSVSIGQTRHPYQDATWIFDTTSGIVSAGPLALEVEFMDKGAGVITPSMVQAGAALPISRSESYTRLNSNSFRKAAFAFEAKTTDPIQIQIRGLQHLHALRIVPPYSDQDWQRLQKSVPRKVEPMVRLARPMDLVTTAGLSVMGEPNVETELAALHNYAPLAKVLGFNGIEMYVRWSMLEPKHEGVFDFSYYDKMVAKLQEYDLKWFPLLIIGSEYALPEWFAASEENVGFVCLEHGVGNEIQSIWSPYHPRHVERVLKAFGDHYEPTKTLLGVRLGPSGNYGESQYPAGGNWPRPGRTMHIHIGMWSADPYGVADYRATLQRRYGNIGALNTAWGQQHESFNGIPMPLPVQILSKRQRIDFMSWYTDSMTEWCEYWALEARKAMPNTPMYQSSGGWGFVEAGTSYSGQTKSMRLVDGGIRLTNETDSFLQNFAATRLAVTAARHYGVKLGYEPASSHTGRGTAARIFNTASTNADHLFTYQGNIFNQDYSLEQWLRYLPILDARRPPVVDVAVYYPETMNQLDDAAFRHLYAWGFNPRANAVREAVEVDYLDELLIRDGFLDKYKVLVFAWGEVIEAYVLAKIDEWLRKGGTVLYPSFPRGSLMTVEGDSSTFTKWSAGDTGAGKFHRHQGDMEPPSEYGEFVDAALLDVPTLHEWTQRVLRYTHPEQVYFSLQDDAHVLVLNYNEHPVTVERPEREAIHIAPYGIARAEL